MLNKVILIGNLGRDPEIRSTSSGDKVANLSLATTEKWKDKNSGERKERTEWHRVTVWGNRADVCEKYLAKGSRVYIEGQLQTRKWQDQSGQDRYTTEVVVGFGGNVLMLGDKPQGSHQADRAQQGPADDLDDTVPF